MNVPLPQDPSFNANNNSCNRRLYERICNEFNVPINTNWHEHGPNQGMGEIYTYDKRYAGDKHYSEYKHTFDPHKVTFDKVPDLKWIPSDAFSQVFTPNKGHWSKPDKKQIAHIKQLKEDYWKTFILDKSDGFTKPGVVRINDSLRTYVWALIGAQAQIKAPIAHTSTSVEVQKQFLVNVEDRISSPIDLPASIKRYQDVLKDASSKLDYVFGIGLRIEVRKGYNNKLMVADRYRVLGLNPEVNTSGSASDSHPQATIQTKVNGRLTTAKLLAPKGFTGSAEAETPKTLDLVKKDIPQEQDVSNITKLIQMKDAIIIGGILCGLYVFW